MIVYRNLGLSAVLLATTLVLLSGCSDKSAENNTESAANRATATVSVDDHSGWWCKEHGIPEEECSMCSSKAAEDCKSKGDWCEEHNRAESQCFKCDPSRAEKFAKLYEAKYGEKPPAVKE